MSDCEDYDYKSCPLFKDNYSTKKTVFEIHQTLVKNNIKNGYTCITELNKLLSSLKSVPDTKCLDLLFKIRAAIGNLDDTCYSLINESHDNCVFSTFYTEEDAKNVKEPDTVPSESKNVKEPENRTFLENEVPLTDESIFDMDYPTLRIPQKTGPYSGERLSESVEKTNKFSPNPSNCTYFMKGNCNHKEKCHFYHPGKHPHRLLVSEAITSYKGVNQALKLLKEGKTDDKNTFLSEKLGFGTHVFVSEKKLCLVTKEELDKYPEIARFHLLRTFINGNIRQKDYVINFVKKHL